MHDFLFFLISAFLIILTPGVGMLFCFNESRRFGIKAGIYSVLGLECGVLIYVIAAAFGLAVLFTQLPRLYRFIQILGALYLVYLAYRAWPRKQTDSAEDVAPIQKSRTFIQGMLVNLSNPKIIIFLVSFMPQFIPLGSAHSQWLFLYYGLIFNFGGFVVNMLVVVFAAKLNNFVHGSGRRVMGFVPPILFVAIAMKILL